MHCVLYVQIYLDCASTLCTGMYTAHLYIYKFCTGMIGCGLAMTFEQLLVARWITGIGSALQNTGAQLFLADISTPANRAQSLGINQVGHGCGAQPCLWPKIASPWSGKPVDAFCRPRQRIGYFLKPF